MIKMDKLQKINEPILRKVKWDKPRSEFIEILPKKSKISFTLQNGPIKEVGHNGCQIDEIGEIWLEILKGFNREFPCRENSLTITKIEEALMWQQKRKENRLSRNVEGYNKS